MPKEVTYKVGLEGFDEYRKGIEGLEHEITVQIDDGDVMPWPVGHSLRVVGGETTRVDGVAKATGAAKYTYDVHPENMAFAGVLGSPHAHAKVKAIDDAEAKKIPGVLSVKTFVNRHIKYPGQPVAAVCAETPAALADGLHALKVRYDVYPAAVTVDDARKGDAPRVDAKRPNLGRRGRGRRNEEATNAALSKAAHVVEAEYRTQIQTHSCFEPHGTTVITHKDGSATVWASTQNTSGFARGAISRGLDATPGRIRVLTHHMGGGFGSKFGAIEPDKINAEFAKELGRPVQGMLTRRQEHLIGGNRPDSIQSIKMGADKDGTFVGHKVVNLGTAGNGGGGAGVSNVMVYRLGETDADQRTVLTHTGVARAFRAPRHPQGSFGLESAIDLLAAKLNVDPLDLRLKNDPHPIRQVQWRIGAERIGWKKMRKDAGITNTLKRGVGCAAAVWYNAGRGRWVVRITMDADGTVTVKNGTQDIGTGTRTVLAMMVAEELGIPPSRVNVDIGDTRHPPGPASGGSTTTPSIAPAAREAGANARGKLEALLATHWGVGGDEVSLVDGVFRAGKKSASFKEACALIGNEGLSVTGQRRKNQRAPGAYNQTAGCQFADVTVDVETGFVKVNKVVAVHDAGRIVNRMTARSQVNGGVIQGVSYALYEERLMDPNVADMVNPTLDTYRILGMADCPEIDVVLTSVVTGHNNAGLMGIGEPATVPTAGAVANAVFHAIGVQVRQLPMTPARVLDALEGRQG